MCAMRLDIMRITMMMIMKDQSSMTLTTTGFGFAPRPRNPYMAAELPWLQLRQFRDTAARARWARRRA